jgi:glycerol-3-phosphate acyltransferase PlsY
MAAVIGIVRSGLKQATEFGVLLVAFAIVIYLLFGPSVPFMGAAVATNLGTLFTALGDNALAGLVTVAVVLYLFDKRRASV